MPASGLVIVLAVLLSQVPPIVSDYRDIYAQARKPGVPVLGGSDFPAFYMGARLFAEEPANSYDEAAQARVIVEVKGYGADLTQDSTWFRYYNPPVYSLLLAPLTLLDVRDAFNLTVAVNLALTLVLALVMGTILRWRQPMTALMLLAVAVSQPLLYSFWHAQPTILLSVVIGCAFLLAERGHPRWAGLVLALAAFKPQWLGLQAVTLLRRHPRALLPLAAGGAVAALPFLFIGWGATMDYIELVRGRGHGDVHDAGFAEALLSWSGFLRATTGSAQPDGWMALSLVTGGVFALIWLGAKAELLPPAAVLATLLIGPHSHPQDWLMLAPAACFLLRDQSGYRLWVSTAVLLGVLLGLRTWLGLSQADRAIYWPTLAGAVSLLWLAVLTFDLDRRLIRSMATQRRPLGSSR